MKQTPYYSTTVEAETTQAKITKMLYEYGAEGTRWTNLGKDIIELEFIWKVETPEGERPMQFRLRPPMMLKKDGEPHPKQTMRLVYWWLKAKLEAVVYGLRSIEQEFLAEVVGQLPSGEEVTVGEMLIPQILTGEAIGPGALAKALPKKEVRE